MSIRAELHRQLTEFAGELSLLADLERDQDRMLAGVPKAEVLSTLSLQHLGLEPGQEPEASPRVLGALPRSARLWTFARSDRMVEVIGIVGIMAPVGLWALAGQTEIAIIQAQWSAAVGCVVGMVQAARG